MTTTKTAVIPGNWVSKCGFVPETKIGDSGRPMIQSRKLGKTTKVFTKKNAEKIIAAYKAKGFDLSELRVLLGKNAQKTHTVGQVLKSLASFSEQNGYISTESFIAAGITLGKPGKNQVFNDLMAYLMKNGCYAEGQRGMKVEEIENPIDLDSLELDF